MNAHRIAAALLLVTAVGCARARPTTSSRPSQYTQQVQGYLARLSDNAVKQGFSRVVSGPVFGSLNDDAEASHEVTVVGGVDYVLLGACDNDCTDLDLLIYDGSELVRRDVDTDDNPVLIFSPKKSGKYRLKVVMAVCNNQPCRYGVQLNAKK